MALRAGLEDLPACMTIQAVGLFHLTPLVTLLALSLAAGDRVMQLLVLLFVGAYYLNADFGIISESHVLAALVLSHRDIAPELRYASVFHWGWTEPTLSILLSPGGRVQAIFGNPALRWQPFDPTDPERLPRLEGHGVDYSAYLAALRRSLPTEGREGAGPPPG